MKKLAILLAVALVLGLSVAVYAQGADKVVFSHGEDWEEGDGEGFVIINQTPSGAVDTTIQIQIRGAQPETEHEAKSGGFSLGTFTTNKKGSGHLHINLGPDDDWGAYINIWCQGDRILRAQVS